jgi:hypothetical protein
VFTVYPLKTQYRTKTEQANFNLNFSLSGRKDEVLRGVAEWIVDGEEDPPSMIFRFHEFNLKNIIESSAQP